MSMSTIVIGYDPSGTGELALAAGLELALALDASVHLVMAFSDSGRGGLVVTAERREAERRVEQVTRRAENARLSIQTHALPEAPADAIVRVARETNADVIVIGNRGAQGARRVLGSIANAIVRHSPCNVFVVKTT
jgi:nucleotide-binding universal stress UspA family protein